MPACAGMTPEKRVPYNKPKQPRKELSYASSPLVPLAERLGLSMTIQGGSLHF